MSRWIGLVGRAGVGKDFTAAKLNELDRRFRRIAFADGVRLEIEAELNGGANFPWLWQKPYTPAQRALLQWWGTDFRREQDPDYWVKLGAHRAEVMAEEGAIPVFTDCRFPNEAQMVKDRGGVLVRVTAPDEIREKRLGQLPPEHPSEYESDVIECDWIVTSVRDDPRYKAELQTIIAFSQGELPLRPEGTD